MSTLQELEDKWAVMMAARDPTTGERIADRDPKYRRECFALRTEIEDMKAGEANRVELSPTQVSQFEWLSRLQGAKDPNGRRVANDTGGRGQKFREQIFAAQARLCAGGTLTQQEMDNTMREVQAQNLTLPASIPGGGLLAAVTTSNSEAAKRSQETQAY